MKMGILDSTASMMKWKGANLYRIIRILSLDVVIGAIASGSWAAWYWNVEMPWSWWLALPMSVWVVYTLDHLLDSYRLKEKAHTERHLFHHRYFRPIGIIWLLCFLVCVVVWPFFLPTEILLLGLVMGLVVLIHLFFVWRVGNRYSLLIQKELGVGLIYTIGVWGGPWLCMEEGRSMSDLWMMLQFLILALVNLLAFSFYEADSDKKDGQTSFVLAIGKQNTWKAILFLALVFVVIMILEGIPSSEKYWLMQSCLSLMLGVLLWVSFDHSLFGNRERYRIWGDWVFWIPGFFRLSMEWINL